MPRPRSIPDSTVLAQVRLLLAQGGEKAVAFSSVAAATGLAPASLAQRYGSVQGMIAAAALDAVAQGLAALSDLEQTEPDKGPQGLLKALTAQAPAAASLAVLARSPAGREAAAGYRKAVQAAIARRLGPKHADAAPMLFAAWIGAQLWSDAGEAGFRLKDLIKRLG